MRELFAWITSTSSAGGLTAPAEPTGHDESLDFRALQTDSSQESSGPAGRAPSSISNKKQPRRADLGSPHARKRRKVCRLARWADASKRSRLRRYETPKSEAPIEAGASECVAGRAGMARPCPTALFESREHHIGSLRVVSFPKSSWEPAPLVRGS